MRGMGKSFAALTGVFVLLISLMGHVPAQQKTEQKVEQKAEQKSKTEQKSKKEKLGKGEMAIAQDLAKESGKSVDEILAMRKSGKGWGQIAHELGVKLGPAVSDREKPEKDKGPKNTKEKGGR